MRGNMASRRQILTLLGALGLPLSTMTDVLAASNDKSASKPVRVRTITAGLELSPRGESPRIESTLAFLADAKRTLVNAGVTTCFTNPGTSEMHFVAALDSVPEMRAILALFEGVATGAADGYGRMAGRPAATLLHLGPGLANGLANLHNAHRAGTPLLNIVGDHATHHKRYDAPLESDIDSLARPVSSWIRRSARSADVGVPSEATISAVLTRTLALCTLTTYARVLANSTSIPQ